MLKPPIIGACKPVIASFVAIALLACQSTDTTDTTDTTENKNTGSESSQKNATSNENSDPTRSEIASLRAELQSLQERMSSSERNIQIILRGVRSGIWDSNPPAGVDIPSEKQTEAAPVPLVAPLSEKASTGPTRAVVSPSRSVEPPTSLANTEGSAMKRIAYAETKMNSGDVNEARAILEDIATEFPNIADNGKTQTLLAECFLRLQDPENAIKSVRRLYLKHPKSPETLQAKLLEARAHTALGNHERAIAIYREVIALAPRTGHAQTARNALQKLRDER